MKVVFRRWGVLSGVGLLALSLGLSAAGPTSLSATLQANRWKKRVLLLYAPTPDDANLKQQHKLFAAQNASAQDRDLLLLDVIESQLSTAEQQYASKQLGLSRKTFAVLLIGKDGGVKQRAATPLTPQTIFGAIDKMPMRRQETRR